MIPIKKGTPPERLVTLKERAEQRGLSPKQAYRTLHNPLKEEVLQQLIEEQGHLCAYCMCSIPRQDVAPCISSLITIEHYIPESPEDDRDVGQGLDYYNFLAVCNGNTAERGKRKEIDLTCDKFRGNKEFSKVNPCEPETLNTIFYDLDGKIGASDPDVKNDLEKVLNLNCPNSPLIAERRAVLSSLIEDMNMVMELGEEILTYCKDRLAEFVNEEGKKTAYAGILIWYLKSMIEALENAD